MRAPITLSFSPRLLLLALLAGTPLILCAQAQAPAPRRPTSVEVERIREEIRRREAERAELEARQALVPWRQLAVSPDQSLGRQYALVRLTSEMGLHRASWTLTPGEGNDAAPVRTPLCWRGEQWIALAPGLWHATVAIGQPGGARAFRFPLATVRVKRGEVYELALTSQVEQSVMALEREAARKAEEAARKLRQQAEGNAAPDAQQTTGNQQRSTDQ